MIIGIIGGMGPLAAANFLKTIILNTEAKCDQDHIHTILDNNINIPDRTQAIITKRFEPMKEILRSARRLEKLEVDFIVIACNTAHYYLHKIRDELDTPVLDLPLITVNYLTELNIKKIGLLETEGTNRANIYQNLLNNRGIDYIKPDNHYQEMCMRGIYRIKENNLFEGEELLRKVVNHLSQKGCKYILAGCSEIPLVLSTTDIYTIIDPGNALASHLQKLRCRV
ncbi:MULTISPECIES: aspartate/glutamate racemase family protein [Bacillus cereus group]|uniref:aspartate/glutamate racemase family protein n=1 Tax=Bacillus cereus group TaxID=86661 RepID=UPI000EA2AA4B|nr:MULTISPECIES: amino acid racemase [Bacillus cereus group]MDF9530189.1 amino acid racemase [Bacillus cereus]MDG1578404.1 amino acid racemase [Bacillus cereus]RKI20795.1 aspartate/glutamate racemase family protein [Bacillus thuringiensis]